MRLAIDQSVLVRELALVAPAARATDSTISRPSQVCLEARDGVLRLAVHNLEYGLASESEACVTEPGAICLSAKPLLSLVSALAGEMAICTDHNHYATIIAGRSRSRMPGNAVDTFTELPAMPEGAIGVPAQTLVRLLSSVSFAVAKSAGRFEVPAVLVRFTGEALVCVATDGRRLALAQAPVAAVSPREFLFPSQSAEHVKKLVEDQERACVATDARHLFVAAGSRLLAARQLAGRFPDFERILSKFDTPPVKIDSAALRSAIARVVLFADSGARVDPKMRFIFRTGELSVSAASVHGGEGEDVVACDYSGSEIVVGFNHRYIREFLDVVPEGKLHVWIKDDHAATEWRPQGDDAYRYVAMPLALKA